MNLLFLYSDKAGRNKSIKLHKVIEDTLSSKYKVTSKMFSNLDELKLECEQCYLNYDVLVIAGGDGTLNNVINYISPLEKDKRPILGYIPTGTLNDGGKTFGIKKNIKKAIKIILDGNIIETDIGKINDNYFLYMSAIGVYSDISYVAKSKSKKRIGKFSYYKLAIKEAFHKSNIDIQIKYDDRVEVYKTPFLLVMNGSHVGGFKVNKSNSIDDGKLDVYITKPGMFNGLMHYLFKTKTIHLSLSEFEARTTSNMPWCLDGEKYSGGDVKISCLRSHLKIFALKR